MTARTTHSEYRRNNQLSRVGGYLTIPRHAIGITVAPVRPFGEAVQVSWLQDPDWDGAEMPNEFEVCETSQLVEDDSMIVMPDGAFSPSVFEPPGESEARIYWLG